MGFQMRAVSDKHIIWDDVRESIVCALIANRLSVGVTTKADIKKQVDKILTQLKQSPDLTYRLYTGKEVRYKA